MSKKIDVVFCNLSDVQRIEGDCIFVTRLEHGDDNLLDKVVYSEDEAYALYNDYPLQIGFSIQKRKPRYFSGSKNIRQWEFVYYKEGFKLNEDLCDEKKSNKLETKTGCKALICFTVKDGIWRVTVLIQSIIMNLHYHLKNIC